jgi:tetratricopeptide (TPR) repeat protein
MSKKQNSNSSIKYVLLIVSSLCALAFLLLILSKMMSNYKQQKLDVQVAGMEKKENAESIKNSEQKFSDAFNSNNFVSANNEVDASLTLNDKDTKALLMKATTLAQQGSLEFKEKALGDEARKYAEQVLSLEPKNIEALTLIGYTYEIQQDYVKAHENYNVALKLDPKNSNTLSQKAHAYFLEGKIKSSEELYIKAGNTGENLVIVTLGQARNLALQSKFAEAVKKFKVALTQTTNNRLKAEIYTSIAAISPNNTNGVNTLEILNLAIENDRSYPQAYVGMAKYLFEASLDEKDTNIKKNKIDDSFKNLEIALKLNPNQSSASLQLIIQLIAVGQKDLANKMLINIDRKINEDITISKIEKEIYLKMSNNLRNKNK